MRNDPELEPLANNGGRTLTHAIKASSPAFERGNNPIGSEFDQRGLGYPRVVGLAPDIGAFEYAEPADLIFSSGFEE